VKVFSEKQLPCSSKRPHDIFLGLAKTVVISSVDCLSMNAYH